MSNFDKWVGRGLYSILALIGVFTFVVFFASLS
jgi:hypothetical protein